MASKKLTNKEIQVALVTLDRITSALNTAVVALCYATKVKGTELDKVTAEEYIDFTQKHVHPLVRRAEELVAEASKKVAEEAKKSVEE